MSKDEKINYQERALQLKSHIFGKQDFKVEEVDVPEWKLPFPIYIKNMSALEKDNFEARQVINGDNNKALISHVNFRASMLVEVICADPEGQYKIFDDVNDVLELGKKSVAAIDRCLVVARRLNNSTKEDEENLLKNLEGQSVDSGSSKQDI